VKVYVIVFPEGKASDDFPTGWPEVWKSRELAMFRRHQYRDFGIKADVIEMRLFEEFDIPALDQEQFELYSTGMRDTGKLGQASGSPYSFTRLKALREAKQDG
jgi:hypothetical protein